MSYESDFDVDELRFAGFEFAVETKHHARVLIVAPPSTDPALVALRWAYEISPGGAAALVDTSRRSGSYAAMMGFFHHPWSGPFVPSKLVAKAETAARLLGPEGVLIIDSLSAFWNGKGGVQDIVDASAEGWKVGGPVYRDMIDDLNRVPCHLIVVARAKTEWAIETRERGDEMVAVARPVATAAEARSGIEFDFEFVCRVDADGFLTVKGPAALGPFENPYPPGRVLDPAKRIAEYLDTGVERISADQRDELLAIFNQVDDKDDRARLKLRFAREVGLLDTLTEDNLEAATKWVTERVEAWRNGVDIDAQPEAPPQVESLPEGEVEDLGDALHTMSAEDLRTVAIGLEIDIGNTTDRAALARLIRDELADEIVPDENAPAHEVEEWAK